MKEAKKKAIEEGITLKQLFTRTLEKELSGGASTHSAPWKQLHGKGSAQALQPEDSGFEGYSLATHDQRIVSSGACHIWE